MEVNVRTARLNRRRDLRLLAIGHDADDGAVTARHGEHEWVGVLVGVRLCAAISEDSVQSTPLLDPGPRSEPSNLLFWA